MGQPNTPKRSGAGFQSRPSRRHVLGALGSTATLALAPAALTQRALAQRAPSATAARAGLPLTAPRDDTADVLHGVRIEDPFRPLEDPNRADVQAYVASLDAEARAVLEGNPVHARVVEFLHAQGRYRRTAGHRRLGTQHASWVHDGVKEQGWLEVRNVLEVEGRTLLDPNAMGPNGSVSIWGYYPDRLSQKVAYLTTENGGDAQTLRIRDVRTGVDLLDRIEGCRFSSVAWLPDGTSFYYTRPPLSNEQGWEPTSHHLFHHQLGYPQVADRMVWRFARRSNVFMSLNTSYTANQLMLTARTGTDEKAGFWVGPISDASLLTMIVPIGRSSFWSIRNVGAVHYAVTDLDAPKRRIVRLTLGDPRSGSWQTIIPESDGVIDGATLVANRFVVRRFKDLGHQVAIHDIEGKKQADIPIEGTVRIGFERGDRASTEVTLDVDDRRRPVRQVRINVVTGRIEGTTESKAPHTLEGIELREIKARSKDGTEVPLTLMHKPGLKLDGANRTLLYGYGSYGISQWPGYSSLAAAWVRLGGVYAVATIRGGSEFGGDWHRAGRLERKQNALDDFAAAAEKLAADGVSSKAHLGIYGASSGGRLVLGAMMQRPELYGAVVAGVPVADMLRFHKHTFGISWTQEYGDPNRPEDFKWLLGISPLHLVKAGAAYPPLMILTADNDQRVVPAHAYKMAAAIRAASPASEAYVRTRKGAGHGGGNALSKSIEYQADIISFLSLKLGGPGDELPKLPG